MISIETLVTSVPGKYSLYINNSHKNISDVLLRILQKNRKDYILKTITLYDVDLYPKWFWNYIEHVIFDQKEFFELEIVPLSRL